MRDFLQERILSTLLIWHVKIFDHQSSIQLIFDGGYGYE